MDTPLDLRLWRPLDILQPMGPAVTLKYTWQALTGVIRVCNPECILCTLYMRSV